MGLRIQSFKQAAFWSTAIGAFSQGLALLFGMVMAAIFGAQDSTDVLYYCLGVFMLLAALIQQVNVSVLVPETMRRREQTGERDAMAFINRFFAVFGIVILLLTGLILLRPSAVLTTISRFPSEMLDQHRSLVRWLVLAFPLQMIAQLLLDILVSYRFLTLPAFLSCMGRGINILFVLAFHRHWGVTSAAIGMVVGFGVQIIVNSWLLKHIIHWQWKAWRTRIEGVVYRNILWVEVGTLASTLANYLPLFLFSGFSAGAMTILNYARRLSTTPTQILTSQLSSVVAVKFNEHAAKGEMREMIRSFDRMCRLLIFGLMPLALGLMLVRYEIVSILFGRGDFSGADVTAVSLLFGVLVLSLPLEAMNLMVGRFFVARQAISQALPFQLSSSLLRAGVLYLCIQRLGPVGFPVGMFLFWVLYLLIMAIAMPRLFPGVSLWPSLWKWVCTLFAGSAVAWITWWVSKSVGISELTPYVSAPLTLLLFAGLYLIVLLIYPPDFATRQYGLSIIKSFLRARKVVIHE